MMSNTGGGHKASAEALKQVFEEKYGNKYRVRRVCDVMVTRPGGGALRLDLLRHLSSVCASHTVCMLAAAATGADCGHVGVAHAVPLQPGAQQL